MNDKTDDGVLGMLGRLYSGLCLRFGHEGHTILGMTDFVQKAPGDDLGVPRAEEIIVCIYSEIQKARQAGQRPEKVFLSPLTYRIIQDYRVSLGSLENPGFDYLESSRIFGLDIYIDGERDRIVV